MLVSNHAQTTAVTDTAAEHTDFSGTKKAVCDLGTQILPGL